MSESNALFIHPLLDNTDQWSAYLVEHAQGSETPTASIARLLTHPLLASFDQRRLWLVPVTGDLDPQALPANVIPVFTALPALGVDPDALKAQEAGLRQNKTPLGLRAAASEKLPGTGTWDHLLITCSHARSLPPYSMIGLGSKTRLTVIDVNSHADFDWAKNNAATLCSAEFLLNRHPPGKKADMTRLKLVQLLSLITKDADTSEIEGIFRQEPKLAYSLLRLVNSAANAPRSPITCFSQAINILGRKQLQRWLQLLVFADQSDGRTTNPLLQKAATRGRFMELMVNQLAVNDSGIENFNDQAFMAGTFSLLDVLLDMPIREVLQHLPLPELVFDALSERKGILGQLLDIVCAQESRDLPAAQRQLHKLEVSAEQFLDVQLAALQWAATINCES